MKTKQVILIRRDLNMRRGKEIAQGAHASIEFLVSPLRNLTTSSTIDLGLDGVSQFWIDSGMPKICLQVNSEQELLNCHEKALGLGLKSFMILDSGRTEFRGIETITACAIGPNLSEDIDKVTADLKLY